MSNSKLHEKKISEIARFLPALRTEGDGIGEPCNKVTESEWGAIPFPVLRAWAIAVVKDIDEMSKEPAKSVITRDMDKREAFVFLITKRGIRSFLIDRFEITEKDLEVSE